MDDSDDIVQEFLVEARESLDQLDRDLLALEQDPGDAAPIASAFRIIHTIKGTSGFLAYHRLESITHVGEGLLSRLRDGDLRLTTEMATALLALADGVREHLDSISESGQESNRDETVLVATLQRLTSGEVAETPAEEAPALPSNVTIFAPPAPAVADPPAEEEDFTPPTPDGVGQILIETGKVTPEAVAEAVHLQHLGETEAPLGELLIDAGAVHPADVSEALAVQQERRSAPLTDTTIRVDVSLLDTLLNLVGELVLARNQLIQHTAVSEDRGYLATMQRLNLITTELQEGVMKTRMQPIGTVWNRFPRIVRDLSVTCGKDVQVVMEGTDTELDKTLIEAIRDPLTHLVRNSVDHGVETPERRREVGKPEQGTLTLRAAHEGGQVVIEISDDGGGIDPEKIGRKAVERGLERAEVVARMSDREVLDFIFRPGFSTAEQVTNVSGRGVGMDVVRTNVEKVGGTVDVSTTLGQGTTFRVTIPLTLAIVPALVVTCGGERFAIPQVSLVELVKPDGDGPDGGIEWIGDTPVHRLRGTLLPLVDLAEQLAIGERRETLTDLDVVVLSADGQTFGLVVDSVLDTEEIVVKPLGRSLGQVPTFAGATIMGDGRVALILDVLGIAQRAGVTGAGLDKLRREEELESEAAALAEEVTRMLVVSVGETGRMAVAVSSVARLEEFDPSIVERTGKDDVVQYRGQIMPLIYLSEAVGHLPPPEQRESLRVIVHGGESPVGLVVDQIIDIVEDRLVLTPTSGTWLRGAAVLAGQVTDVVDVEALVAAQRDGMLTAPGALAGASA